MNAKNSIIDTVFQEILRGIDIYKPITGLHKNQFHFDYSESVSIQEYFTQRIEPTLLNIFQNNEFVSYSLKLYPRRQLYVFTDIWYKRISHEKDAYLSSILYGVWSYLLWVDDTVDHEETREGQRSMTKFDKNVANKFIEEIFNQVCVHFGRKAELELQEALGITIASMQKHALFGLDLDQYLIYQNYFERGAAYITWPTSIISNYTEDDNIIKNLYSFAITKHIGSQMMNDIKDLYTRKYSDLINHQPTVPLLLLFHNSGEQEKRFLLSIFGKQITDQEREKLNDLISSKDILVKTQLVSSSVLRISEDSLFLLDQTSKDMTQQWLFKFYIKSK